MCCGLRCEFPCGEACILGNTAEMGFFGRKLCMEQGILERKTVIFSIDTDYFVKNAELVRIFFGRDWNWNCFYAERTQFLAKNRQKLGVLGNTRRFLDTVEILRPFQWDFFKACRAICRRKNLQYERLRLLSLLECLLKLR